MRAIIFGALVFAGAFLPAQSKLIPDTPPTTGEMYRACDDWLRGDFTSHVVTCRLYMQSALSQMKSEGVCPPSDLEAHHLAYAFNRYLLSLGSIARDRKDQPWESFRDRAWRIAWPCS